ncbi:MAG: 50S ribosomal protein L24 [Candidatus Limnocylindrales bacterium]
MASPSASSGARKVPELRRGDEVVVLSGKDAGKHGKIERVIVDRIGRANVKSRGASSAMWRNTSPRSDVTVVVGGLNMAKRHTKPRPRRDRGSQMPRIQAGGILDLALPMSISKVMLLCPACGRPTRVKHTRPEGGRSLRICGHTDCGQPVGREMKA